MKSTKCFSPLLTAEVSWVQLVQTAVLASCHARYALDQPYDSDA